MKQERKWKSVEASATIWMFLARCFKKHDMIHANMIQIPADTMSQKQLLLHKIKLRENLLHQKDTSSTLGRESCDQKLK